MNQTFKRLPLAVKLILIGLIPLIFLVYLTLQVYQEKDARLQILNNSIDKIHQSANLSSLINALETERKISFDYALGKARHSELYKTRPATDRFLSKVESSDDPGVYGFKKYTNLDKLAEIRTRIDSNKSNPEIVMHYYSNSIFRLNTLNSVPQSIYLQSVYKDMVAQKLLTEMSTYLGIIRSNIYNVLITRKYMIETLIGITGTFDVYKSYEKEFLMKVSPEVGQVYQKIKNTTDLKPTRQYLDSLFKRYSFDSTLSADQWWKISNNSVNELSKLQQTVWKNIETQIQLIYKKEKADRDRTLLLFIIILVILAALITYTILTITNTLSKLKVAAQKIAKGSTAIQIKQESNDVIGELTNCVAEIANANKELAQAAEAIGNGNFKVEVKPRSEEDVLGNAIVSMRDALDQYSGKMESLVRQRTKQLEKSNNELQQFAHVTSHDLKEPLRKISIFSERLMNDTDNQLSDSGKTYLSKISQSASRMIQMINGILSYSSVTSSTEPFELVDLNAIMENVKTDLELLIEQKNAKITVDSLPQIEGAPILLNQLFYNLLNNALKFSKQNVPPAIHIQVRKLPADNSAAAGKNNCYEITVKDNGIGFEAQYAEKIFDTFSRLHSVNQYEGTGLGLALCKRIIEYHHGKIWAESNGSGANFKILIPQKQDSRSLVNN